MCKNRHWYDHFKNLYGMDGLEPHLNLCLKLQVYVNTHCNTHCIKDFFKVNQPVSSVTQTTFTFSKLAIEILERGMKDVQS